MPPADAEVRGGTYWDPLATLGYLAARTERIRLATYVLVLGYHHPLAIAKRYGTLDRVSGGRLVLGVGRRHARSRVRAARRRRSHDRGERADDALRALRAVVGPARGRARRGRWIVEPHAANPETPFWIGGRTRRSLRRAVELGDGWAPFWLNVGRGGRVARRASTSPPGFEVVGQPGAARGPDRRSGRASTSSWTAGRDAGATVVDLHVVHHSLDHYLEQLEALAA